MYYLNTFIFYSIIGHLIETIFFFIIKAKQKSGILYLWWTPLYGFGAVISLFLYKIISKNITSKVMKNAILLILYFISFTLLEILGGFFIKKIFNYEMWNYSNIFGHMGKYASVPTSLLWSVLSLAYIYFFKKISDHIINKTPKAVSILLTVIFIIDSLLSIAKAFY